MKDIPILRLGKAEVVSPLLKKYKIGDSYSELINDSRRILNHIETGECPESEDISFEKSGPREKIYFDPGRTSAAIVTCGGLCPGLNNVIRSLVLELYHNYGVCNILGIPYGYQGMGKICSGEQISLNPGIVDSIERQGGSILGSSRGNPPVGQMVDFLAARKVNILFTVGGDGTQKGALEISREARRRGMNISIVGIPKTIDNDLRYVDRTFGVITAVDRARDVLDGAHAEAKGYYNGIVLVKLMGRESGFIAAGAALASQQANFVLIPELPFKLEGERGFLAALKERVLKRHHALIVAAEGAGQDLLSGPRSVDASGNVVVNDIGQFLKKEIASYFSKEKIPVNLKYIDPGYYIRSVAAGTDDCVLCDLYARHAVHAAMSGRTEMIIGFRRQFVHIPMEMAVSSRQRVPLDGDIWRSVLSATGQPVSFI